MSPPPIKPPGQKPSSLKGAQDLIRSIHTRIASVEVVPLADGLDRCLAQDIVAPVDLPLFDVAAMDGYAIRSTDLDSQGRADLRVVGEVAAGHPADRAIQTGEAMRIYTGAVIVPGADRVVPQERCTRSGNRVSIATPLAAKAHIRLSGEDVLSGQTVLPAGMRLGPGQIAFLAALGFETVPVWRRLRVVILSVGDELAEAGAQRVYGRITDTNRPMLKGWLEKLGCIVEDIGIVPDAADLLLHRLVTAAASADLIVTSGGASVGPADYLARLITRRGYLEFWQLNMRPGRPVGFGDIDDCPIIALPGNPFAAAAAFHLIGRVLVARLSGDGSVFPEPLVLPLAGPVRKKAGHLQILAGKLARSPGGATVVTPLDVQSSASLLAIAGADGLILLPEEQTGLSGGEMVEFVLF